MMTKREVVRDVLEGRRPPYVPWQISLTEEARGKLAAHLGEDAVETFLDNHFLDLGSAIGFFDDLGENRFRDAFGVVWDRTVDRDIGQVVNQVLTRPSLDELVLPDPLDGRFFDGIDERIAARPDRFRIFSIGFSLFERAWTLRGMENLLIDLIDHPAFVHDLLAAIADYDIAQARAALEYDIDAVYFGDDWGQQQGLIMGPRCWTEFIRPQLERMYAAVRDSGRYVIIHSCGDVNELFDDLIALGVGCFNPFQPEVMDVAALLERYRGRLAFHGGLSTQRTLPFGNPADVRAETRRLLERGAATGLIIAPAHAVPADVPLENMLALVDAVQSAAGS
jgi:uroporphyrinogen decarboxylase